MAHFVKTGLILSLGLLTACAGGQQHAQTPSSPAPVIDQAEQPAPVLSDTFRIALLLPLSGPSKDIGQAALDGAMMGFYEYHTPQDVELELYDTRGTQDGARRAAEQAVRDNANAIVGPVFSANVAVVADVVEASGLRVLALSNDKLAARENVKVLGPHLESEAEKLLQMAASSRSTSVLMFAPQNGYGVRLEQEFQRLMEDNKDLVFKTVLFPDRANVDELTQLISQTGNYEARTRYLQDILNTFQSRYAKVQDASRALTYAVDRSEFTDRWADLYPMICTNPEPDGDQVTSTDAGTVQADGSFQFDILSPTQRPGGVRKIQPYKHARVCEIDVSAFANDLAREYALKQEAEQLAQKTNAVFSDDSQPKAPVKPEPSNVIAPSETETSALILSDHTLTPDELQSLMDSVPDAPTADELLAERLKTELDDARFGLLDDMAACIGYLAERGYDEDRGIDAMVRTLSKREVLGPPEFDTLILPLSGDQLRMVSSLFDFYHVGPPHVQFFGDSQWDKIENLHDEPSLRHAKWLSVSRPFSEQGRKRFNANFNTEPAYISALAFDAVGLVIDQTKPDQSRKTPPQTNGYIMGESGAFRINEDGTNDRVIGVKSMTGKQQADANKNKPEASILKASGPQFGEDREMYLKRTCLGQY